MRIIVNGAWREIAGNELAARYRIRTGRKIGSAALVADGLHARTDGLTSLAVLLGVWELHQDKMATRELLWQYRNQLTHFARAKAQLAQIMTPGRRSQVLADLDAKGVLALDVYPENLTTPLINSYLEIKARHLL